MNTSISSVKAQILKVAQEGGVIIDQPSFCDNFQRCPTITHPNKRNGSYLLRQFGNGIYFCVCNFELGNEPFYAGFINRETITQEDFKSIEKTFLSFQESLLRENEKKQQQTRNVIKKILSKSVECDLNHPRIQDG